MVGCRSTRIGLPQATLLLCQDARRPRKVLPDRSDVVTVALARQNNLRLVLSVIR